MLSAHGLLTRRGLVNLFALIGVQGGNALVPLLVVPFALSMMGPVAYAHVAIAEAISTIVLAGVLFSFEVDGVARIANLPVPHDRDALGRALSDIISARLVLFVSASAIVTAGFWFFQPQYVGLLLLWLLVPFGQVFHSYWFYQGIERNVAPAVITLTSRVATIAIVALKLRTPADQYLLPLAVGLPFAIGGLVSTAYLVRTHGLSLRWAGGAEVVALLRHGKEVFAGNAAVTLYREMNVVIMGIAGVGAASIATYAYVEKSVKMLQACTRPLNQLFFPKVLTAIRGQAAPSRGMARVILAFTLPQIALVAVVLLFLSGAFWAVRPFWPALNKFAGLPDVGLLLAIMLPVTLVGLANFMFGTAGLNYLGERRYYLCAILVTGIASALACFSLSVIGGAIGAATCFLGAETLLLILVMARYARRSRLSGTEAGYSS